jgi:hypothetical protein
MHMQLFSYRFTLNISASLVLMHWLAHILGARFKTVNERMTAKEIVEDRIDAGSLRLLFL